MIAIKGLFLRISLFMEEFTLFKVNLNHSLEEILCLINFESQQDSKIDFIECQFFKGSLIRCLNLFSHEKA
jgi:hypothetical protein